MYERAAGQPPDTLGRVGVAMGAGAVSALVSCPSEFLVIHQQKSGQPLRVEAASILQAYGPLKLYRGLVRRAGLKQPALVKAGVGRVPQPALCSWARRVRGRVRWLWRQQLQRRAWQGPWNGSWEAAGFEKGASMVPAALVRGLAGSGCSGACQGGRAVLAVSTC